MHCKRLTFFLIGQNEDRVVEADFDRGKLLPYLDLSDRLSVILHLEAHHDIRILCSEFVSGVVPPKLLMIVYAARPVLIISPKPLLRFRVQLLVNLFVLGKFDPAVSINIDRVDLNQSWALSVRRWIMFEDKLPSVIGPFYVRLYGCHRPFV